MKAEILPVPPQPFVIRLEFDSEKQYAFFKKLFTTTCVCEALISLGEPALGKMWDKVLPDTKVCSPVSSLEITSAIREYLTV